LTWERERTRPLFVTSPLSPSQFSFARFSSPPFPPLTHRGFRLLFSALFYHRFLRRSLVTGVDRFISSVPPVGFVFVTDTVHGPSFLPKLVVLPPSEFFNCTRWPAVGHLLVLSLFIFFLSSQVSPWGLIFCWLFVQLFCPPCLVWLFPCLLKKWLGRAAACRLLFGKRFSHS